MPEINLKGTLIVVDDAGVKVLEDTSSGPWAPKMINGKIYVYRVFRENGEYSGYESLHRVLTRCPAGLMVDHINGDTLDNRPENLRICSHAENMRNRKIHKNNRSGFKGVYFAKDRNKWRAQIRSAGKKFTLGYFSSPEAAHKEYVKAAAAHHGDFSRAA
jgi:hypothetical protein